MSGAQSYGEPRHRFKHRLDRLRTIERIPGKVSGRPIVRGTRILADTIVEDAELGSPLEEIQENYPDLSLTSIQELILFAHSHRDPRLS